MYSSKKNILIELRQPIIFLKKIKIVKPESDLEIQSQSLKVRDSTDSTKTVNMTIRVDFEKKTQRD